MKASIKFAVVGALALMGGIANAANVNIVPSASTGSSLLLLLKNATDGTFFYSELGTTVGDLRTKAQVSADGPGQYSVIGDGVTGPLNAPGALLTSQGTANLQAYLAGNTSDNITWTVLGSRSGTSQTINGETAFVATTTNNFLDGSVWGNNEAYQAANFFGNNFIAGDLNAPGVTFTNGVSSTNGWGDTGSGALAPISFNGSGYENGAGLNTAQSLYMLTATGTDAANVYKALYTLTLSSAGILSYDAPISAVPVPAAIWLLGSGLMGLVGIGRRRSAAELVAA